MIPSVVGPCFAQPELNSPLLQLAAVVQVRTGDIQDVAAIYSAPDSQKNYVAGELWEAGHSWPTELLEPVAKGKRSAGG